MTMHVASMLESWEPKAEIGDHFTMERTNQHWTKILNQYCAGTTVSIKIQMDGKKFLLTVSCLRNKNVLELEAGMLEKIRTF